MRILAVAVLMAATSAACAPPRISEAECRDGPIRVGDQLQIPPNKAWLIVDADGSITLASSGRRVVAGLSVDELSRELGGGSITHFRACDLFELR